MPYHACARRRWRRRRWPAGAGAGPGRARVLVLVLVLVWVWVPYLAWFFLNQVSRVWAATRTKPAPPRQRTRSAVRIRTDPPTGVRLVGRPRVASLLDCQRLRTYWTANGCKPVGLPKVANQLDGQRVQWLGRKVAAFHLGSNLLAPPAVLYKAFQSLN